MTVRLLIGSTNPGKFAEYRELLAGLDLELVTPADLGGFPEPPEDAAGYRENAIGKALAYQRASGLLTVADDSGLEVTALRGAPGVRSRRFFGEDATAAVRNARILALLDGVADRSARFVAVVALAWPDGRVETFDGELRGEIGTAPAGQGGFGYDPIFRLPGDGRALAELPRAEKDRISHRGVAGVKLRASLATEPR
jgi:XTP/dITP diphosphohydrolase